MSSGSSRPEPGGTRFGERFLRRHLVVLLAITCLTAWRSYAYFHNDEYFQVLEYARAKLGDLDPRFLPWEHGQRMRPWLLPFVYWLFGSALRGCGVRDVFAFAFVCRLAIGLCNVFAAALFLRTSLSWMETEEEKRLHVRVVTLLGFLPYLFVRTSSESASMAALTIAFALLLEGASAAAEPPGWTVPALARPLRCFGVGLAFGIAFELRFQSAFFALGVLGWLFFFARTSSVRLALPAGAIGGGGLAALGLGALVDRWGYGVWTFPAWTYFEANILDGAAGTFGSDPPLAYLWLLPANVCLPVVLALLALAFVAWLRCPRHPVTWATFPFFVVHNVIAHKEERFLFPLAVVSTALVTMAIGPSFGRGALVRFTASIARWGWAQRRGGIAKALVVANLSAIALLASTPFGWNHNVRFMRFVDEVAGDDGFHATALPEIDLSLPAFHPVVYDVDKADPEEISRRIMAGTARRWLISDRPVLRTGSALDTHATLVFSELPGFRHPAFAAKILAVADAYNEHAPSALRRIHFRSLYRLDP